MLDLENYKLKDTIMYAESRKLGTSIYASKEYNENGDYKYLCLTFSLHNVDNFDDEYDNVNIMEVKNTFNNETELRRCMEKHFKFFNENRKLQKLVEDFYEYTTTISITEWEYFCNLEYIEEKIHHRETTREDYIKESQYNYKNNVLNYYYKLYVLVNNKNQNCYL